MPLTTDQLNRRREGIGASEIAAVVGLVPQRSPIAVWQAKCELRTVAEATPATERGDFLEPALRSWYAYRFNRVVHLSDTLQHPDHQIVLATPDGISVPMDGNGEELLLEIKSPGRFTQFDWGDDGTDLIPLYYLPQVTWAMAVTRLKTAHVVALVHSEMRCYTVPYDQDLFAELLAKGQEFWSKYVVPRKPPPVDGSASYAEYLARKFRKVQKNSERAPTQQTNALSLRLMRAQAKVKHFQSVVDETRNQIKALMGNHERLESPSGYITWRQRKDTEITDWRALAEEMGAPESMVARHTRVRPGTRTFLSHFNEQGGEQ